MFKFEATGKACRSKINFSYPQVKHFVQEIVKFCSLVFQETFSEGSLYTSFKSASYLT